MGWKAWDIVSGQEGMEDEWRSPGCLALPFLRDRGGNHTPQGLTLRLMKGPVGWHAIPLIKAVDSWNSPGVDLPKTPEQGVLDETSLLRPGSCA